MYYITKKKIDIYKYMIINYESYQSYLIYKHEGKVLLALIVKTAKINNCKIVISVALKK